MPLVGATKMKTNFEWPSQTEVVELIRDTKPKLASIKFKQGSALKGIQLGFSPGTESPLFETERGSGLLDLQTVDIEQLKKVR